MVPVTGLEGGQQRWLGSWLKGSGELLRPRIKLEKQPDLRGWTAPPKAKVVAKEGGEMAEFWGATTIPT